MTSPTPPSKAAAGTTATARNSATATASKPATASRQTAASRSAAATVPRANGAAWQSSNATGVQTALAACKELYGTFQQLEHELQSYNQPNVVGRDTILLRSFFDQGVGRMMQIAQALKINWTPPQSVTSGRR